MVVRDAVSAGVVDRLVAADADGSVADGAATGAVMSGGVVTGDMLRAASVTNFCRAVSEAELEEDEDDEARAACAANCFLVILFMPPCPFGVITIKSQLLSFTSLCGLPERPAACTLYLDGSMES